jgi:toxin ParE1/3/4
MSRSLAVVVAEAAERDLRDIWQYIARHGSVVKADRVFAGIDLAVAGLAEMPRRGNVPKELAWTGIAEFREVHFKPYRVVYRVEPKRVTVLCILDGRRDMQSLLLERLTR